MLESASVRPPLSMKRLSFLLPLLALAASAAADGVPPVRTANGLKLPAPAGFEDVADYPDVAEIARVVNEADRENRTFANFVLVAPVDLDMDANAKVPRKLDGRICDRSFFRELARQFSDEASQAKLDRTIEKGVRKASKRVSKGLSESFGGEVTHSGVRRLPVHRTTPRSTHFSLTCTVRTVDEDAESEMLQVASCAVVWLRGRILNLSVSTTIADAEEPGALDAALAKTRDAVRDWEAAVVASNALLRIEGDPVSDPSELDAEDAMAKREGGNKLLTARNVKKSGFDFERLWLDVALGAFVGAVVALVNTLKKRRARNTP